MTNPLAGTLMLTTALFVNNVTKNSLDPDTVILKVEDGSGHETTYTYQVGAFISRMGVGSYSAQIDTTAVPGIWNVQWEGIGQGPVSVIVKATSFVVDAPPIP